MSTAIEERRAVKCAPLVCAYCYRKGLSYVAQAVTQFPIQMCVNETH